MGQGGKRRSLLPRTTAAGQGEEDTGSGEAGRGEARITHLLKLYAGDGGEETLVLRSREEPPEHEHRNRNAIVPRVSTLLGSWSGLGAGTSAAGARGAGEGGGAAEAGAMGGMPQWQVNEPQVKEPRAEGFEGFAGGNLVCCGVV